MIGWRDRAFVRRQAAAATLLLAVACRQAPDPPPTIALVPAASATARAYVEIDGLNNVERRTLASYASSDDWQRALTVSVKTGDDRDEPIPIAGTYEVKDDKLRFTPRFPFDPGRQYEVRLQRGAIAREAVPPTFATVALPAPPPAPPTFVTEVYPTADVIPENQLRFYIHFSAPMARDGGLPHVQILDDRGRPIDDPFLPVDADFWNSDHTRFTVFFEPGRQKRGILPNRRMGRSLVAGRRYTLRVNREWRDGHGNPLRDTWTRTFRVGPADLAPIAPAAWRVEPPRAGTRDAITVRFPRPLDHGLLARALGVARGEQPVTGNVSVSEHETVWSLRPHAPWQDGSHDIVALSILEDLAGNRIGRPFEIVSTDRGGDEAPEITRIPFRTVPR
jgi:hypothetical protein